MAYSIVQSAEFSQDGATYASSATTNAFASPVGAGNLLHWVAFAYPSADPVPTLSFSGQAAAEWVQEGSVTYDYSVNDKWVMYYGHARNTTGGTTTGVTVTASAAGQSAAGVYNPATGTDTLTTATPASLSGAPACVIGFAENDASDPALNVGTGFTNIGTFIDWTTGDTTDFIRLEHKRITTPTPVPALFSNAGANGARNLAGVSIYVEAGSSDPIPPMSGAFNRRAVITRSRAG